MFRYFISFFVLFLFSLTAKAQLVVNNTGVNKNPNYLVQNILLGTGVTASNITFTGRDTLQLGYFDGSNSNIGINKGIILSTGDVRTAVGPNVSAFTTTSISDFGGPNLGDVDLDAITSPVLTFDASVLEFDFVPIGDSLIFRYVFASEEYLEFVGSAFNDVFGFFISGPGFAGPYSGGAQNIALIPGTSTPVAINNINSTSNSNYYIDNETVPGVTVEFDGFTVVLTARAKVQCNQTYHIKLAVADVGDNGLDSSIFLEAESFFTPAVTVDVTTVSSDSTVVEGCTNATFNFTRASGVGTSIVHFNIAGNAINGTDYAFIADSIVLVNGQLSSTLTINPLSDGVNEGVDTIRITVFNITTCGDTIPETAVLFVNDQYSVNTVATAPPSICIGANTVINATPTGGIAPYVYSWSTGATTQSTAVSPLVTTQYKVLAMDSKGCLGIDSVTVQVNSLPIVDAGANQNVCSAGSYVIGGSPTGPLGSIYVWSPAASLDNATLANPTASPIVNTRYIVTVTDANGCTQRDSMNITIGIPFAIDAGTDKTICLGANTTLGGAPTGPALSSYVWSPATNLNSSTSANPVFTSTATGSFTYTVSVDNGSCIQQQTIVINVSNAAFIDAGVNTSICNGAKTVIGGSPSGSPGSTYVWNPAGGLSNATIANPTVTALTSTTYTLTVTDLTGCTNIDSVSIVVNPLPIVDAGVNQNVCAIGSYLIGGTPTGPVGSSYVWSPAASLDNPTLANPTASPLSTTTYTLTVNDMNGCIKIDSVQISIGANFTIDAGVNKTICNGVTASLGGTPTAPSGSIYNWLPPTNLNNTTIANPIFTAPASGIYTYTVSVTNAGCTGTSIVTITVNNQPLVNAGNNVSICSGENAVIGGTPTGGGGSIYSWSPPTTINNTSIANPTINPLVTKTYTLTLTDVNGCTGVDSVYVTVNSLPNVSLVSDTAMCVGDSITLSALSPTASVYNWSPLATLSASNIAAPIAKPTITTTYTLQVTDLQGCTNTATSQINVSSNPIADFSYELQPLCEGVKATFLNLSTNGFSYKWIFGDGTTSTDLSPTHIYAYGQNYGISLITYVSGACSDTAIQTFNINESKAYLDLHQPNVITPNDDGINDTFLVSAKQGTYQGCSKIQIYNRWGVLVFESVNYNRPWDGHNTSGAEVPSGVYYYVYSVKDLTVKGFLTLLR